MLDIYKSKSFNKKVVQVIVQVNKISQRMRLESSFQDEWFSFYQRKNCDFLQKIAVFQNFKFSFKSIVKRCTFLQLICIKQLLSNLVPVQTLTLFSAKPFVSNLAPFSHSCFWPDNIHICKFNCITSHYQPML